VTILYVVSKVNFQSLANLYDAGNYFDWLSLWGQFVSSGDARAIDIDTCSNGQSSLATSEGCLSEQDLAVAICTASMPLTPDQESVEEQFGNKLKEKRQLVEKNTMTTAKHCDGYLQAKSDHEEFNGFSHRILKNLMVRFTESLSKSRGDNVAVYADNLKGAIKVLKGIVDTLIAEKPKAKAKANTRGGKKNKTMGNAAGKCPARCEKDTGAAAFVPKISPGGLLGAAILSRMAKDTQVIHASDAKKVVSATLFASKAHESLIAHEEREGGASTVKFTAEYADNEAGNLGCALIDWKASV
jgi:hypothetical protein